MSPVSDKSFADIFPQPVAPVVISLMVSFTEQNFLICIMPDLLVCSFKDCVLGVVGSHYPIKGHLGGILCFIFLISFHFRCKLSIFSSFL